MIAVTDTYNHKIKVIDPFNNEIFSWLGNGKSTLVDAQTFDASLNEPSGISSIFDHKENDIKVFIADCNNHCIRYVHYDTGIMHTPEMVGIPVPMDEEEESKEVQKGTLSANNTTIKTSDTTDMEFFCDGDKCYPSWKQE